MSEPFYIKVKVRTNQKKENIISVGSNRFEIDVTEKPERNLANKRIIEILNDFYKNPEGGVKIINGQQSPVKLFKIGR